MNGITQKEGNQPVNNNQTSRKKTALLVFASLTVIGAIVVFFYLQYKGTHIATDDAFIDGHIHTIAAKISGTVRKVYVEHNQLVKLGDILVDVDPIDYDVKVNEAASAVNAEKAKLNEKEAGIEASKKFLVELEARLEA